MVNPAELLHFSRVFLRPFLAIGFRNLSESNQRRLHTSLSARQAACPIFCIVFTGLPQLMGLFSEKLAPLHPSQIFLGKMK